MGNRVWLPKLDINRARWAIGSKALLSLDVFSSSFSRHTSLRLLFGDDGKVMGFGQGSFSGNTSNTAESSDNLPLLRSRLHNFKGISAATFRQGFTSWPVGLRQAAMLVFHTPREDPSPFWLRSSNLLGDGHGDATGKQTGNFHSSGIYGSCYLTLWHAATMLWTSLHQLVHVGNWT